MLPMSVCCCRSGQDRIVVECALRHALERTVEELLSNVQALIGTLDQVDGDADLEPSADAEDGGDLEPSEDLEPSLGWSDGHGHRQQLVVPGVAVDAED